MKNYYMNILLLRYFYIPIWSYIVTGAQFAQLTINPLISINTNRRWLLRNFKQCHINKVLEYSFWGNILAENFNGNDRD